MLVVCKNIFLLNFVYLNCATDKLISQLSYGAIVDNKLGNEERKHFSYASSIFI